jgi:TetR/AcrR family transcriptional regulator, mexJK operon transcriptional repressor
MQQKDTSEIILKAAMMLFSQKGFNDVGTKEIAKKAHLSEMTVFRKFHNKRNLFEKALERYFYTPKFKSLFAYDLSWNLEKDLVKISFVFHETLSRNKRLILATFKNMGLIIKREHSPLDKFPNELKTFLMNYFLKMKKRKKLKGDPEILAINFLSFNFGIFIIFSILKTFNTKKTIKMFITQYVKNLTEGG